MFRYMPLDIMFKLPSSAWNSTSCDFATIPEAAIFCVAKTARHAERLAYSDSKHHLRAVFKGTRTS